MDLISALFTGGASPSQQAMMGQPQNQVKMAPYMQRVTDDSNASVDPITVPPLPKNKGPMVNGVPPVGNPNIQQGTDANPTIDRGVIQSPQQPTINYNNSADVNAVHGALSTPRGGSDNPGIYGLLPQNLQHGTLRNVLGALGDAFLVGGGKQPEYEQRMQRQEMGDAMTGMDFNNPDSVRAAVSRLYATGAPGAAEMADKVQQQAEQAMIHKQLQEQALWWHEQQSHDREQNSLNRIQQITSGQVMSAATPEQYAAAYKQAEAMAQRVGPDYHATDLGYVDPSQWKPGMYGAVGMTGNNVQQASDRAASRGVTMRGQDLGYAGKVRSAQISAGRPTEAGFAESIYARAQAAESGQGPPLDSSEQAAYEHYFGSSPRNRQPIYGGRPGATAPGPGTNAGAAMGAGAGGTLGGAFPGGKGGGRGGFVEGHVYTDKYGNTATYHNGKFIPH